jgi:hypothetical protein
MMITLRLIVSSFLLHHQVTLMRRGLLDTVGLRRFQRLHLYPERIHRKRTGYGPDGTHRVGRPH